MKLNKVFFLEIRLRKCCFVFDELSDEVKKLKFQIYNLIELMK